MPQRRFFCALTRRAAALGCCGLLAAHGLAQSPWPARPIRLVVPFPPGGGADFVSRITARHHTDALRQSVYVDNRPGASGTIGSDIVARAAPDGYTLGIASSSTHPAAAANVASRANV